MAYAHCENDALRKSVQLGWSQTGIGAGHPSDGSDRYGFAVVETPNRRLAALVFTVVITTTLLGCTGEEPIPVDLNETIPSTTLAPDPDDPNAAERQRMEDLAAQQCLDDPELAEGVTRLVDPETNEAVAEVTVDCATVR